MDKRNFWNYTHVVDFENTYTVQCNVVLEYFKLTFSLHFYYQ